MIVLLTQSRNNVAVVCHVWRLSAHKERSYGNIGKRSIITIISPTIYLVVICLHLGNAVLHGINNYICLHKCNAYISRACVISRVFNMLHENKKLYSSNIRK